MRTGTVFAALWDRFSAWMQHSIAPEILSATFEVNLPDKLVRLYAVAPLLAFKAELLAWKAWAIWLAIEPVRIAWLMSREAAQ